MKYNREEIREQHKDLFEYSLNLIYVSDLKGNVLDANDTALNALGYERQEIENISFVDLLDEEQISKAWKATLEIMEKGRNSEFVEYKLKKKDGKYICVKVYGIPLKKKGKVYAVLGIGHDITERKLAEEALRKSEEKYRTLVETSSDLIGLFNLNGTARYVNKAYENRGYTEEELKDISVLKLVHLDDIKMVETALYKLTKGNQVKNVEYRSKTKSGIYFYLQTNFYPIMDSEGELVSVLAIARDITKRKEAEEKLKESEIKYRHLFENTPSSILLINSKGVIIDCNPTTEKMLGYTKEDLIGKDFKSLSAIPRENLPILLNTFKKFIKGEEIHRLDLEIYKKDGSLIWGNLQSSKVSIRDEIFMQLLIHDVSERKNSEFLIKEQVRKLEELEKIRKNLMSRVSHELKTPLFSISGGAEFLSIIYKTSSEKEIGETIKLIERGSERLKKLVDKLLDVSRIEYEKLKLDKQEIDLGELIKECSEEMRPHIKKRELNLELKIQDEIHVNADGMRIEQVFLNLLSNAIKNTPPKGNITISLKKKDDTVELSVKDTGVGLTRQEMKQIFTRFGKIERYRPELEYLDIQGSGLGLFISKQFVYLHGGDIWVESNGRNKGAKFVVTLPIN